MTEVAPETVNQNKTTEESNIDSELLGQSTEFYFLNKDNVQLEFFIPLTEDDRDILVESITKYGGKVSNDPSQGFYLSKYADGHREVYDPNFVYETVRNKRLQAIENYRNHANIYDGDRGNVTSTDAERDNVEQLVSYLDNNRQLDEEEQQNQNRANIQLAQTGINPHQHDAQPERTVSNKNGFTSEEDEIILELVRKNPMRRSTHKLFQEIAHEIGRHTGNSIRYRFRTHLANDLKYVYKVDSLGNLILDDDEKPIISKELPSTVKTKFTAKDDFELCKAVRAELSARNDIPYQEDPKDLVLAGKFFESLAISYPSHTKAAWRDRYRKFAVPYGIDKFLAYYETEVSAGRIPQEIKNFTGKHLYKSRKTKKDSTIDEVIGERLSEHNDQFNQLQKKRKTPGNYNSASDLASDGINQDSTNIFIAGGQDELNGLDSTGFFNSHAAAAVAAANRLNNNQESEDFLTEDLVTPKFFEFQPLISVVEKVDEIVNRNYESGDAEQLITALFTEAGIQKKFGTFIITSVCGDLVLIPKFIEVFLKTGENPPLNIHGIWSPRDDGYLRSGDSDRLEYLKRLHGPKRIELRKQFINQDLV